MKLISLSNFVLDKNEYGLFRKNDNQIREYAEFLQQDLTLSMFLPCNDDEKPLVIPECWDKYENAHGEHLENFEINKCIEYNNALNKLIFLNVDFHSVEGQKGCRFYIVGETQVFNISDDNTNLYWHHYTIESLLHEYDETIIIKPTF